MTTLSSSEITTTILALLLLLVSSFLFGKLFELIKAPKVVGEIFGGMVVGGSGLALLCPTLFNSIFNSFPAEGKVLNIFYQLGLIFLMFSSGFNTTLSLNKQTLKNHTLLFIGSTFIPMSLAIPLVGLFEKNFIGTVNNHESFVLVFLISVAITSIPVISKIFFDIGMMNTKYSNMVLTVSTLQDLCLWILLNLSISLAENNGFKVWSFIFTICTTIGLLGLAKLIDWFIKKKNIHINSNVMPIGFILLLLIVFGLSKLGINMMYSSFIGGYILKSLMQNKTDDVEKIKDFSFAFFIPIYFALVGLQLDVVNNFSIPRFLLYFAIAFGLEFVGTFVVMLFSKLKKLTVVSLAITMNARGGPGIVLATTAYAANIINLEFFTVLIITTMISSAIAGYWLRIFKEKIKDVE